MVGWLLGRLAVGEWTWAAVCGLTGTLGMVFALHGQTPPVSSLGPLLGLSVLGVLALWTALHAGFLLFINVAQIS